MGEKNCNKLKDRKMKTNKHIIVLIACCISILSLSVNGQAPALPSIESVFKQYQAGNTFVSKSLREKYLIANPAACKFEMQQNASVDSPVKSEWNVFKSNQGYRLNWYWPEDRATVTFKVTTPPNKEGVKYVLPLVVEYSRIKSSVLQNSWSYYSWHFGNPWRVEGGKEDALFHELLVASLFQMEGHPAAYSREMDIQLVEPFTSISKIEKSERPERRESYSDKESVIRQYVLTGETIEYDIPAEEEAIAKENYTNSKGYIEVVFERSVNKTQRGDWTFVGFEGGPGNKIEHGTPTGDKNLYKTAGAVGFREVYQKEKQPAEIPYFSDVYEEIYTKNAKEAFADFFLDKPGAEEKIKAFIVPGGDEIIKAFKDQADKLKNTFVELKPGNDHPGVDIAISGISFGKVAERGKMYFNLQGKRKGYGEDKSLKKKYQEAGMSKEALSKLEAQFDYQETIYLKLVEFEGKILISEAPVFTQIIDF